MILKLPQKNPENFQDLFDFYHNYVKLLYSYVQVEGVLPNETLFELNAALDHLSRYWEYGQTEQEVVIKAYGHMKRCCLDVFKIKLYETTKQYNELRKINISVIDNGDFENKLKKLWQNIKQTATHARRKEGQPTTAGNSDNIFRLWEEVFVDCMKLEEDFYFHPKLEWAKRKGFINSFKELSIAFIVGVISALVATGIVWILRG